MIGEMSLERRVASGELAPELALPAFDGRALARRAAPAAAAVAAAAAVLALAGGPLHAFRDAFDEALSADPRWVAAALVLELLSFTGYVALLSLVGGRAHRRLGPARQHADHARRRGRDAPAADGGHRGRRPDDLVLPPRRPERPRRDPRAARLPRRPVLGVPGGHPRRRARCSRSGLPPATARLP